MPTETMRLNGFDVPGHEWCALDALARHLAGFTMTDVPGRRALHEATRVAIEALARMRSLTTKEK
jgi:hypothetical protein